MPDPLDRVRDAASALGLDIELRERPVANSLAGLNEQRERRFPAGSFERQIGNVGLLSSQSRLPRSKEKDGGDDADHCPHGYTSVSSAIWLGVDDGKRSVSAISA